MQMNSNLVKRISLLPSPNRNNFFVDFNELEKPNIPIWWENSKACIKRKILCYSSKTNRCNRRKKLSYEDETQIISNYGRTSITVLVKDTPQAKKEKHAFHISRVEYIKFHLKQIIYSYKLPWKIKTTHTYLEMNASWWELLKMLSLSV